MMTCEIALNHPTNSNSLEGRGYAMTRSGVDGLKEQLWAEAMRHGLGRAIGVLIVAGDRFPGARQRVDFYHVSQHFWSVAHTLHPDDAAAARA
jgi:hypothetical protein